MLRYKGRKEHSCRYSYIDRDDVWEEKDRQTDRQDKREEKEHTHIHKNI